MPEIRALVDLPTEQTTTNPGDLLYGARAGVPYKMTVANFFKDAALSGAVSVTGAATFTNAVDLSGATVTLASNMAPTPAATDVQGYWKNITSTVGGALTLDAGGTWAYAATRYNNGVASNGANSVAAGGTTVGAAASGQNWIGFAWRIQE